MTALNMACYYINIKYNFQSRTGMLLVILFIEICDTDAIATNKHYHWLIKIMHYLKNML